MQKYLILIYRLNRRVPLIASIEASDDATIRFDALELMNKYDNVTGVIVQTMQERVIMTAAKRVDDNNVIDLRSYKD